MDGFIAESSMAESILIVTQQAPALMYAKAVVTRKERSCYLAVRIAVACEP